MDRIKVENTLVVLHKPGSHIDSKPRESLNIFSSYSYEKNLIKYELRKKKDIKKKK